MSEDCHDTEAGLRNSAPCADTWAVQCNAIARRHRALVRLLASCRRLAKPARDSARSSLLVARVCGCWHEYEATR